jgi:hypothetical protein
MEDILDLPADQQTQKAEPELVLTPTESGEQKTETQVVEKTTADPVVDTQAADEVSDELDEDLLLALFAGNQPAAVASVVTDTGAAQQTSILEQVDFKPLTAPINIPQELQDQIFSEDPATSSQGLGMLCAAIYNEAANASVQHMKKYVAEALKQNATQTQTQTQQSQAAKAVSDDFYSTHPTLASHKKIVQKVTEIVMQKKLAENPNAAWTPELRDEIARNSRAFIARFSKPVAAKKTPATYIAGNARPPMQSLTQGNADDGFSDLIDSAH